MKEEKKVRGQRSPKEKPKKEKPKYNMWQTSWFMIKLAWNAKEKKVLVLCLLAIILAVASNLVQLYISPTILAAVESKASVSELLLTIIGFAAGSILIAAASAYVEANTLYGRVTVRSEIVAMLNKKAATTSYPNLDDEKFNKLLDKAGDATSSNWEATEAIWDTLTSLVLNVAGLIIYASLLTSVQPLLLLVILVTATLGYFINKHVKGYWYRHRDEVSVYTREINYLVNLARDYNAAKDIRIFGVKPWLDELMEKSMGCYTAFQRKGNNVEIWAKIADLLLAFLRNGVAYAFLIHQVIAGDLSVSQFLLYFSAVSGFAGWVSGILGTLNGLYKQSLDISTVRECLEYPEPFAFAEGEKLEAQAGKDYEIELKNVSFRYPGAEKDTLQNINLTLHSGEKLAVVGLNGAGKTTMVKLICGFLDPTEGQVLLNGVDIRTYNRADYYKMFSAVFQAFTILAGTVASNVAQTEDDIDMERVKKCVEKAGLQKKVESMPKGYETHMNRTVYEDACMLSGGETQRLMLAKALYKDAPFIILDEPTAALDPIAESDMYQKYNEMTGGKSSVYISHRLASTRFCDRIIFLENARIAEVGTHEDLIEKGGKYAELFEVQSKYYQEGGEADE